MAASSLDIATAANTIIELARRSSTSIDAVFVTRVLYVASVQYHADYHRPLLDEQFVVAPEGPLLPRLLDAVGRKPIRGTIRDEHGRAQAVSMEARSRESEALRTAWNECRGLAESELRMKTQVLGGPWSRAFSKGQRYWP